MSTYLFESPEKIFNKHKQLMLSNFKFFTEEKKKEKKRNLVSTPFHLITPQRLTPIGVVFCVFERRTNKTTHIINIKTE